jgi:hypothetical protein
MNHAGDFFEQETGRLRVEDPETVEGPDHGLVTLLAARMIVGKADGRRYRLKLSRRIFESRGWKALGEKNRFAALK